MRNVRVHWLNHADSEIWSGPCRIETIFRSNDPQKYFERKVLLQRMYIFNRFQSIGQNVIIEQTKKCVFYYF